MKSILKNHSPRDLFQLIFVAFMFILALLTFIEFCFRGSTSQTGLFFPPGDTFNDFFNMMHYVSDGDPYQNTYLGIAEKHYPPLSFALLLIISKAFNHQMAAPIDSQIGVMAVLLITVFSSIITFLLLYEMNKGRKIVRALTAIALFVSGIFLFSLERGNVVLVSNVFLGIFLMFYDDSHKYWVEVALVSIAIAISMKVLPVVFLLLLIYQKRYSETLRVVLYVIVLNAVSNLALKGGVVNILYLLRNMQAFSEAYLFRGYTYRFGLIPLVLFMGKGLSFSGATLALIGKICGFVSMILFAITALFAWNLDKKWKTILLITCAFLCTPDYSATHNGLALFFPIILFLNDPDLGNRDWFYLAMFLLALNPLQIAGMEHSISSVLSNIAVLALYLHLSKECLLNIRKHTLLTMREQFLEMVRILLRLEPPAAKVPQPCEGEP